MWKFLTNASLPLDNLFLHAPNPLLASECENVFFFGRVNVLVSTYFCSLCSVPTSLCFHWSTIFLISVSEDNLRARRNESNYLELFNWQNNLVSCGRGRHKTPRPWNVYFNAINLSVCSTLQKPRRKFSSFFLSLVIHFDLAESAFIHALHFCNANNFFETNQWSQRTLHTTCAVGAACIFSGEFSFFSFHSSRMRMYDDCFALDSRHQFTHCFCL